MRDCPIIQANREVMALHSKNRSKNRLNPTDVQHRQRPDNIANPTKDVDQFRQIISPVETRDNLNL